MSTEHPADVHVPLSVSVIGSKHRVVGETVGRAVVGAGVGETVGRLVGAKVGLLVGLSVVCTGDRVGAGVVGSLVVGLDEG